MSESSSLHKAEAPQELNFGVFICSTSRNQKKGKVKDASGELIKKMLRTSGYTVKFKEIIPDNKVVIEKCVQRILISRDVDVCIFCGGIGISRSDVTIETVSPYLDKKLPGFGEIFRFLSYEKGGSAVILSRAIAGISRGKVFFCIPGSPDAVKLSFESLILPEVAHIVKHIRE